MRVSIWWIAAVIAVAWVAPVEAQQKDSTGASSRVVAASAGTRASETPALRQTIAVDLKDTPIADALQTIARLGKLKLLFGEGVLGSSKHVTLQATKISVSDALAAVLRDTGLEVTVSPSGQVVIAEKQSMRRQGRAATGEIVGKVTDAKTGAGVARAEIFLEKPDWSATTDTTGNYRLPGIEPGRHTLTIRRPGYARQDRTVELQDGGVDTVDVALEPVATRLQELVTTATGRRRRMDIANDVTTIKADSVMQAAPIRNVTDLLDGRVPGLTVQRTSGAPGDPARLRLRGAASALRNNDPIVVVDGVRVYAQQSAARNANLANFNGGLSGIDSASANRYAAPSPLDFIDPNTIETIEVLKGPSAATLYGQDAANGVIVITTKRGKPGPARWTASVEQGRTQMAGDYPALLFRMGTESFNGQRVNCPASNLTFTPSSGDIPCSGDTVRTFQLLSDPALTVLGHGRRTSGSLTISGGTPALTYAVTATYAGETGLPKLPDYEIDRYRSMFGRTPPDWMRRPQQLTDWGVTSNLSTRLGAHADVTLSTKLSRTDQQRSSLEQQLGPLMATYLDPVSGIYYQQNNVNLTEGPILAVEHPLEAYYERATAQSTALTNSATLTWRPKGWLTLSGDAGLNVIHRADEIFFPNGPVNFRYGHSVGDTTGYVNDGQGTSLLSTLNLGANALAPLGRGFTFRFAAGANYAGTSIKDLTTGSFRLPPGTSLRGDSLALLSPAQTSDATFGWYAEPSVGNSKLNFSSGLRLDGGSAYGSGASGLSLPKFPKLGFSYLVSDEPWFPFKSLISSLRLRVSYGRASRQPGVTDRLRLYQAPGEVFVDSQLVTGVLLAKLGNTEVRPERSAEFEGGFDADLWDSRLSFGVTGYRKTTDDALLAVPVAPSVYTLPGGYPVSMVKNIGVLRNTGVELTADLQLVRSAPVTWSTHAYFSQRRDVVVKLGHGVVPFYTDPLPGGGDSPQGGLRVAAGYPLFGRWSRPILGYADVNGDGVLQSEDVQLGDTAVYVGSSLPNYTAAFGTTLGFWHGAVTITADFQYDDGLTQRNEVARRLAVFARGAQVPGTPLADQAASLLIRDGQGMLTDYNWIQTVNALRFNSFSVRYMVPPALAHHVGAQTLSVAVQGGNLRLWTNYRGLDPNVNAFSTGNNVVDTGILPQPRTWQLRVQATY